MKNPKISQSTPNHTKNTPKNTRPTTEIKKELKNLTNVEKLDNTRKYTKLTLKHNKTQKLCKTIQNTKNIPITPVALEIPKSYLISIKDTKTQQT